MTARAPTAPTAPDPVASSAQRRRGSHPPCRRAVVASSSRPLSPSRRGGARSRRARRGEGDLARTLAAGFIGAAFACAVQLHVHGSMAWQAEQAAAAAIDGSWWTDPDFYPWPGGDLLVARFDFDRADLSAEHPGWPEGRTGDLGFEDQGGTRLHPPSRVDGVAAAAGPGGWRAEAPSTPFDAGWRSNTGPPTERPAVSTRPLLAGVTLSFKVRPPSAASPDAELWTCVPLSEVEGGRRDRVRSVHGALHPDRRDTDLDVHEAIDAPAGEFTELRYDLSALARGSAFFGDPVATPDRDAWSSVCTPDGAEMGQVLVGREIPVDGVVDLDPARPREQVRFVVDGVVTATVEVAASGPFAATWPIDPAGGEVVRAEAWDAAGEALLFTNPLYFAGDGPGGALDPGRLAVR